MTGLNVSPSMSPLLLQCNPLGCLAVQPRTVRRYARALVDRRGCFVIVVMHQSLARLGFEGVRQQRHGSTERLRASLPRRRMRLHGSLHVSPVNVATTITSSSFSTAAALACIGAGAATTRLAGNVIIRAIGHSATNAVRAAGTRRYHAHTWSAWSRGLGTPCGD